jgi:hypothetical protein
MNQTYDAALNIFSQENKIFDSKASCAFTKNYNCTDAQIKCVFNELH